MNIEQIIQELKKLNPADEVIVCLTLNGYIRVGNWQDLIHIEKLYSGNVIVYAGKNLLNDKKKE